MIKELPAYYSYNGLLVALSPVLAGYLAWTVARSRRSLSIIMRQLGLGLTLGERRSGPRVWIQAVSVGETVASEPVFSELRRLLPEADLTLSTTTSAGNEMAKKSVADADHVIYFPIDLVPSVKRALAVVNPDVFVMVETEIWPNFLFHCRKRGVPVAIVNGCLSDRTYNWGRKLKWVYKWALSGVDKLCMQSAEDARRVIELGARPECVEVVGNCKFDQLPSGLGEEERRAMRDGLKIANGDPVLVAGSTNPGEEEQVMDAFRDLRRKFGNLRLIIAPRQLNRTDSIASIVSGYGFSSGRRSEAAFLSGKEDVVILDTMGELAAIYGIASVAFVGGSLIPKGGHNILQPIAHGRPVVFGPYTHKTRDLVRITKDAGVGFQVQDSSGLCNAVDSLLSDAGKLREVCDKAVALIETNRGASRRCAEAIAGLCPK